MEKDGLLTMEEEYQTAHRQYIRRRLYTEMARRKLRRTIAPEKVKVESWK